MYALRALIWGWLFLYGTVAEAQYAEMSSDNSDIEEYVAASPENADTSLMYVFYNNAECTECAEAVKLIYDIYEQYYSNYFNIFSVNYAEDDTYDYAAAYDLSQPLAVVLVRVQNGQPQYRYKIDNPQIWLENADNFTENMLLQINNFISM